MVLGNISIPHKTILESVFLVLDFLADGGYKGLEHEGIGHKLHHEIRI